MSNFNSYEEDQNTIWIYKIEAELYRIYSDLFDKGHCRQLRKPNLSITTSKKILGSWKPDNRMMSFSYYMLKNCNWETIREVIRHETAHQIVSEVFEMDCYGVSHGAAFERACGLVGIKASRFTITHDLSEGGELENPIVDKIRKIIIHGNDSGATTAEAEMFLKKAQTLMLKHNLQLEDVTGRKKLWLKRPLGNNFNRYPSYMNNLGCFLKEHYNVNYINITEYNNGKYIKRLEIFGEPMNLDIAEFIGHSLLNQADILYKAYLKDLAKQRVLAKKNSGYGYYSKKTSKSSFMAGLLSSYSKKLDKLKVKVLEEYQISHSIVPMYDKKILKEMFESSYNVKYTRSKSSRGAGYGAGSEAGSKLTLSKGVSGNESRQRMIA